MSSKKDAVGRYRKELRRTGKEDHREKKIDKELCAFRSVPLNSQETERKESSSQDISERQGETCRRACLSAERIVKLLRYAKEEKNTEEKN